MSLDHAARSDRFARALAGLLALLAFALCGGALAWFGWVDAPISDGAMLLVAAGLLAGALAAGAALLALELGTTGGASGVVPARRVALALLLASLLLLVAAAALTLNLRGTGEEADDDTTVTHLAFVHVLPPARL